MRRSHLQCAHRILSRQILPRQILSLVALLCAGPRLCTAQPGSDSDNKRDAVAHLVNQISYGVPSSPGLELLPGKPTEVTHLTSGQDVASTVFNWFDGDKLRTGVAVDGRPLARWSGPLRAYQAKPWKQVFFRTTGSLATVPSEKGTDDVLLAGGLRIPLIDRGDPRADAELVQTLEGVVQQDQDSSGAPGFEVTVEESQEQLGPIDVQLANIRKEYAEKKWNALRVDLGIAGSLRAMDGTISTKAMVGDRGGLWLATSGPVSHNAEFGAVAKVSWVRAQIDSQETRRQIYGGRVKMRRALWKADVSLEAAAVIVDHDVPELDDDWWHVAGVAELPVPAIGGWIGIAYGGDVSRRDGSDARIGFHYAIYKNRILAR